MGQLLGLLNIAEAAADKVYVSTLGQRIVYDAVRALLDNYNKDLARAKALFVERTTTDHKLRYKLPGSGRLQRRGGLAQSATTKATGYWDVAFPLEDFGAAFGGDDIALAYMTAAELDRHMQTIMVQDVNTVRYEMLKALLNSSARTFSDDIRGSLTIEPLANGDAVVYPPALGSESEATDNHYLESGYLATAISDTNNPFPVIRRELTEHFGVEQGGEDIAVFINSAETPEVSALASFDEMPDRYIRPGQDTAVPTGVPANLPGVVLGRADHCWVVEWDWVPASYMVGIHLAAPAPLIERVDPEETGLGRGLQLVAKSEEYPLETSNYRHRFGFGVGNRLSAMVLELGNGGTYTVPSGY